jgi:hypothetical protein
LIRTRLDEQFYPWKNLMPEFHDFSINKHYLLANLSKKLRLQLIFHRIVTMGTTEHIPTEDISTDFKGFYFSTRTILKFLPTVSGLREAIDTSAPISPKRRG